MKKNNSGFVTFEHGWVEVRLHILLTLLIVFFVSACDEQNLSVSNAKVSSIAPTIQVSVLEVLTNPYADLNEIVVESSDERISHNLQAAIQALSEIEVITALEAEKRIATKVRLLDVCNDDDRETDCEYVSEWYEILSREKNILNIKYMYGAYRTTNEWFKYGAFDLNTGARVTYNTLFSDPSAILAIIEERYVAIFQRALAANKQENEEQENAYYQYTDHLNNRAPFELGDLNNMELVLDETTKVSSVRFHYNGGSGYSRIYFDPGYIELTLEELEPYWGNSDF